MKLQYFYIALSAARLTASILNGHYYWQVQFWPATSGLTDSWLQATSSPSIIFCIYFCQYIFDIRSPIFRSRNASIIIIIESICIWIPLSSICCYSTSKPLSYWYWLVRFVKYKSPKNIDVDVNKAYVSSKYLIFLKRYSLYLYIYIYQLLVCILKNIVVPNQYSGWQSRLKTLIWSAWFNLWFSKNHTNTECTISQNMNYSW